MFGPNSAGVFGRYLTCHPNSASVVCGFLLCGVLTIHRHSAGVLGGDFTKGIILQVLLAEI